MTKQKSEGAFPHQAGVTGTVPQPSSPKHWSHFGPFFSNRFNQIKHFDAVNLISNAAKSVSLSALLAFWRKAQNSSPTEGFEVDEKIQNCVCAVRIDPAGSVFLLLSLKPTDLR